MSEANEGSSALAPTARRTPGYVGQRPRAGGGFRGGHDHDYDASCISDDPSRSSDHADQTTEEDAN